MPIFDYFFSIHIWIIPKFQWRKISKIDKKEDCYTLFLDIDGTLWDDIGPAGLLQNPPPKPYWDFLKNRKKNISLVLVTNQSYLARMEKLQLKALCKYFYSLIRLLIKFKVDALLICNHHFHSSIKSLQKDCQYRKPSPLMISKYTERKKINMDKTIFIGDRISDMICATSAGINRNYLLYNSNMFSENYSSNYKSNNIAFFTVIKNLYDLNSKESWFSEY